MRELGGRWSAVQPRHPPAAGLRHPPRSPLGPGSGPHSEAIEVAEGCLRIAVRAHISLLLSPQNLMWGAWSSVKRALGTSPTGGEWQKELGQIELILQPVLNRGLLDLGHQSIPGKAGGTCPSWAEARGDHVCIPGQFVLAVR